jgi:hypothetical protein
MGLEPWALATGAGPVGASAVEGGDAGVGELVGWTLDLEALKGVWAGGDGAVPLLSRSSEALDERLPPCRS